MAGSEAGTAAERQDGREAGYKRAEAGRRPACTSLRQVLMPALIRHRAKDTNLEVMSKILCSL